MPFLRSLRQQKNKGSSPDPPFLLGKCVCLTGKQTSHILVAAGYSQVLACCPCSSYLTNTVSLCG